MTADGLITSLSTAENLSLVGTEDKVSRSELISLLEGFLTVLKKEDETGANLGLTKVSRLTEIDFSVDEQAEKLKHATSMLVEAQDTIIKLLTDRVEDRARIAALETEVRLLPDLQAQADRAMGIAFRTEEFRVDLNKVKYELECYRMANVRAKTSRGPRDLWTKAKMWLLKAKGLSLRAKS